MNPLLDKAKSAILAKAKPQLVPAIQKTAAAGIKVLNAPSMQQMIKQELGNGDNPEALGSGVAKIGGILSHQSHGQLPPEILVPACMLVLLDGLQALEENGNLKVTPDFLATCTKELASALGQLLGVNPDSIAKAKAAQQGGAQPAPPMAAAAPAGGIVTGPQGAPA